MKSLIENCAVLILAAGSGARMNLGYNKILYAAGCKTVLERTVDRFIECGFTEITVAVAARDLERVSGILSAYGLPIAVAEGGLTRAQSVRAGLARINGLKDKNYKTVIIHDGARPFVTDAVIRACVESAVKYGSGVAAVPAVDTVKRARGGVVTETLERAELYNIQTPQAFDLALITRAYAAVAGDYGDDAQVLEKFGRKVYLAEGDYGNIKLTRREQLFTLNNDNLRLGIGFDVHPLTEGRDLILGGVKIPHYKGLSGHSDADALTHAVTDALCSAAGLPDIGALFPDTDVKYKGADSAGLLIAAKAMAGGIKVINVSAAVMAQKPKLAPYIPSMRARLAGALGTDISRVNISATTTECLGIVGEEKGIAASASVLAQI